ncbi:MAG: hypothetical protein R3E32_06665 [Chitinophagales bacterium]
MLSNTLFEVNEILQLTLLHYAAESSTKSYNDTIVDEIIHIIEKIDRLRSKLDVPPTTFDFGLSHN